MEKVVNGKFVSVEYTGTFEDGEVFDSSKDHAPLEVHMGAGMMIPGFEAALLGLGLNEKKKFTLSPEEAYGPWDEENVQDIDRKEFPPEMATLEAGMTIGVGMDDGQEISAKITKVTSDTVTLDMNHPMAGKALTFDVEVVGISDTAAPSTCGGGCGSSCGASGCECC